MRWCRSGTPVTGALVRAISHDMAPARPLAFMPDGALLAVAEYDAPGGGDGSVRLWAMG